MHDDKPAPEPTDPTEAPAGERAKAPEAKPPAADKRLSVEELERLVEGARMPVEPSAEKRAQQLNKSGLKHHKRLELTPATQAYLAALKEWPGHVYSRYNLACALQLQRRPQESLDQLAILRGLSDRGGLDLLREARLDDDFASARSDLRFRELTGYIPVEVVPGSDGAARRVDATITQLRGVHVPATEGERWPSPVQKDTLYVRADDPAAVDMADEINDALGAQVERHVNARLSPKRPVVLVLADAASPTEEPSEGSEHSPEAFIGAQLTSEADGALHRLHLKERRFFTWETRHEDGRRVGRTGTYYFLREKLHLDFQETTETPSEFDEPTIEVHRGKREHHLVSTDGVTLTLGDLSFKRR